MLNNVKKNAGIENCFVKGIGHAKLWPIAFSHAYTFYDPRVGLI